MSGGLAPSKSTVYVGNLPFSLTNNDIHKVFERFGHIAKVTILRDKETRESKGVAFVQFVQRADAVEACRELHNKEMFDRTMKCTIAKDNGRAPEFIKRREYPDKSSCYECGEEGHLSYNCPKNLLGDREQPVKKNKGQRKRARAIEDEKRKKVLNQYYKDDEELAQQQSMYEESECADYSLSDAIKHEADRQQQQQTSGYGEEEADDEKLEVPTKKKVIKKSSYFSDEEEEEEL